MDKASLIGTLIGIAACGYVGYRASEGKWSIFYSEKGMVMVTLICNECDGSGTKRWQEVYGQCEKCKGTGEITLRRRCPTCGGTSAFDSGRATTKDITPKRKD